MIIFPTILSTENQFFTAHSLRSFEAPSTQRNHLYLVALHWGDCSNAGHAIPPDSSSLTNRAGKENPREFLCGLCGLSERSERAVKDVYEVTFDNPALLW
jgi:hypothetical protein